MKLPVIAVVVLSIITVNVDAEPTRPLEWEELWESNPSNVAPITIEERAEYGFVPHLCYKIVLDGNPGPIPFTGGLHVSMRRSDGRSSGDWLSERWIGGVVIDAGLPEHRRSRVSIWCDYNYDVEHTIYFAAEAYGGSIPGFAPVGNWQVRIYVCDAPHYSPDIIARGIRCQATAFKF